MQLVCVVSLVALGACSDNSYVQACESVEDTPDVQAFGGVVLDQVMPGGAGSFALSGFDWQGPVTAALDLVQVGDAYGRTTTGCPFGDEPALVVPSQWRLTTADGYLDQSGEADIPITPGGPRLDDTIPASTAEHAFDWREGSDWVPRSLEIHVGPWPGSEPLFSVQECFDRGESWVACRAVYATAPAGSSGGADPPP